MRGKRAYSVTWAPYVAHHPWFSAISADTRPVVRTFSSGICGTCIRDHSSAIIRRKAFRAGRNTFQSTMDDPYQFQSTMEFAMWIMHFSILCSRRIIQSQPKYIRCYIRREWLKSSLHTLDINVHFMIASAIKYIIKNYNAILYKE